MFRSLFGKGKNRRSSNKAPEAADESIRSAGVGDVVVISGYSPSFDDAYFLVESTARYESPAGKSHELMGVDGDRRVAIEWSDYEGLFISVRELGPPLGLSAIGLTGDDLVHMDESHSIESSIEYQGGTYFYRNSHEMRYYREGQGEPDGFYGWEFLDNENGKVISVVKGEEAPFEVYTSSAVSPDIVSVYKR